MAEKKTSKKKTDETPVEETAAELGQIKLLRRAGKQGLGSAYRQGFSVALDEGYEVVVSMDVDFSHDPAVLPELLRVVEAGADAVIGSRYVPGGATVDWPRHRRLPIAQRVQQARGSQSHDVLPEQSRNLRKQDACQV